MGDFKREYLEPKEQLYSDPPSRTVCLHCVTDPHLAEILARDLEDEPCFYCGSRPSASIATILDEVSLLINADYTDPANELMYVSAEGGYQGEVLTGAELVYDLDPWTNDDRLMEDVATEFAESFWCRRDYYGLSQYEALTFGWSSFSAQVKHQTRYLFLKEMGEFHELYSGQIPAGRMLDALGELFNELDLMAWLPAGAEFVRARIVRKGERPSTPFELGTAPVEKAILPNRMSPAGIPMFYGAWDESTAVRETYKPLTGDENDIVLARFRSLRNLKLLDLVALPDIPSQFDHSNRLMREPVAFLHGFERDFTQPVDRDARVHTEYVPTQVVTEYVRHHLRGLDGEKIDGIMYQSSRQNRGAAVVLFADSGQIGPLKNRRPYDPEPLLELISCRYTTPKEFGLCLGI